MCNILFSNVGRTVLFQVMGNHIKIHGENEMLRLIKLFSLASVLVAGAAHAGIDDANFGTLKVAQVTSIYDGDTFRANIAGVHPIIGERISIRVAGVDTPEMRGQCAQEKALARKAKQATVGFLRDSKNIELRDITRGKYFRIVANVYGDGRSLTQYLISNGFAVPYDGGKKAKDWCK